LQDLDVIEEQPLWKPLASVTLGEGMIARRDREAGD
jgi:hypothetical protein